MASTSNWPEQRAGAFPILAPAQSVPVALPGPPAPPGAVWKAAARQASARARASGVAPVAQAARASGLGAAALPRVARPARPARLPAGTARDAPAMWARPLRRAIRRSVYYSA